ncbi:MAG: hypothetical protein II634_00865, partial [Lachnospiraceae bacterium]|nr:hypothetical protein [Lachnospiraceae bacterium]
VTGRNSEYPGWQYREESKLRELWISEYRAMYGKDPEVMTIHAGLECGLILTHLPDVDAVSFGPNILASTPPTSGWRLPPQTARGSFWCGF